MTNGISRRLATALTSAAVIHLGAMFVAAAGDGEAAVEAGRDALNENGDYNWYDDQLDDIRRIEVEVPKKDEGSTNTNNNVNSLFAGGDWFTPLAWIGIALLLGIIVFLLIRAFLAREQGTHSSAAVDDGEETATDQLDRVEELPVQIRRPRSDLLSEAGEHYEAGNFREAIIYLYSHELVQLDKRDLIHLTKGKTNRQYLSEVAGRSGLHGLLQQTMIAFEDVFFGDHNLTRERFESCWKLEQPPCSRN